MIRRPVPRPVRVMMTPVDRVLVQTRTLIHPLAALHNKRNMWSIVQYTNVARSGEGEDLLSDFGFRCFELQASPRF